MTTTSSRSYSVQRVQLIFGLPCLLFPCEQSSGCLVVFVGSFLSVWPIQLHFLLFIVALISSCLVFFQSSLFDIFVREPYFKDVSEATVDEDLAFVVERLSSFPRFTATEKNWFNVCVENADLGVCG